MSTITLRASGSQAPDDMQPGEWLVRCEHGEINVRGNKISAVLNFRVLGKITDKGFTKENGGVVLKQWYFLSKKRPDEDEIVLDIHPHSKYGIAWALAMGRPMKSTDDPEPKAFENKFFRVDVGFRSGAGGVFHYKNLSRKKDAHDFLRIHTIFEKIEEKALSHMTPYDPIWDQKHVHALEHGHEHDTRASTSTLTPASTSTPTSTSAETDNKIIRMNGASHMGNEQVPQGHANPAPGVSSEKLGITAGDVLRRFPGAKVVEKSAEQQFQLIKSKSC